MTSTIGTEVFDIGCCFCSICHHSMRKYLKERPVQKIQGISGSKEEAVRLLKTMPWALVVCVQREENVSNHSRPGRLDFKIHQGKA